MNLFPKKAAVRPGSMCHQFPLGCVLQYSQCWRAAALSPISSDTWWWGFLVQPPRLGDMRTLEGATFLVWSYVEETLRCNPLADFFFYWRSRPAHSPQKEKSNWVDFAIIMEVCFPWDSNPDHFLSVDGWCSKFHTADIRKMSGWTGGEGCCSAVRSCYVRDPFVTSATVFWEGPHRRQQVGTRSQA
jgi:hypothetical protein